MFVPLSSQKYHTVPKQVKIDYCEQVSNSLIISVFLAHVVVYIVASQIQVRGWGFVL